MKFLGRFAQSSVSPYNSRVSRSFPYVPFVFFAVIACLAFAQQGAYDWNGADVVHLANGVDLAHVQTETPRKLNINCARVDSTVKGISFYTTPGKKHAVKDKEETLRQTTRDFMTAAHKAHKNMVVAINADAFSPWPAPWNMALPTDLHGLAVSDGKVVSPASGTPSLLIYRDGSLAMKATDPGTDLSKVLVAVSGFGFCLENGAPTGTTDAMHPRTGYGLSEDRRYLLLMTVDGRRHASQGCTIAEVGEWLKHFGAYTGINMDGGGSTTIVRWDAKSKRAKLVNQPVGNGERWIEKDPELEAKYYRPTERANGNNFGVIAVSP